MGKQGSLIYNYANGLDYSPVCLFSQREKIKSVGNGITFKRNLTSRNDILTAVTSLSDTVASRLRKYEMKAYGVKVDIKDPSFKTISRQKQLDAPTNLAEEIIKESMNLITSSWIIGNPIRLITITAINLTDETVDEQLSIFSSLSKNRDKGEKIERTMDDIRKKFGSDSISFAQTINNDLGIDL